MFRSFDCPAFTCGLRRSLLACALTVACVGGTQAATATDNAPPIGVRAIEGSLRDLAHVLGQSRGAPLDNATRQRIVAAAQAFQAALKIDGGARANLDTDAKNIIASLSDGSFSADGSLNALHRDAKGSVLFVGKWNPGTLQGTPIPGPVGTHLNQTSEGDCVGISVIKAFSNTRVGEAILHKTVTGNPDGSFTISLPGDPTTVYHLSGSDLDQYGTGDPSAAALVGAMFQYFHMDPKKGALPTNKVMELLAGHFGEHQRLADRDTSAQGIVDFLTRHAADVGSRTAMVFGGKPSRGGDWTQGDGHAFAVIRIDPAAGLVTYTNPWNEGTTRTLAIAELARQAAGTSADFETITFR
ncbi:hypothetical protein [Pseudomonas gingeri]|uniref:hypothetical protein n=1 Tax=Pseudomonas gingeri TaxID=117681 RepID=UPI0034CDC9CD